MCRAVSKKCGGGAGAAGAAAAAAGGPGGRDSCIVSLHAPVAAVTPALCLGLSAGDVCLAPGHCGPEAGNSRGQWIFQTAALQRQRKAEGRGWVGRMTEIIKARLY